MTKESQRMKGGETMKKEWAKPELEVLDVNMTMASTNDHTQLDANYPAGTKDGYIWS